MTQAPPLATPLVAAHNRRERATRGRGRTRPTAENFREVSRPRECANISGIGGYGTVFSQARCGTILRMLAKTEH